ncbi:MAG: 50S ribosomal protein L9 [Candidatus Hydrogenedentota bacterium]|nr:MAG: 50S ribosomal protein L9 [Candidatus Hydrogenedentota bacterium]
MKVILCEDVDNVGDMGEQVNVARGYARNFLLPRKMAVLADSGNAKQIEHEMRIIRKREEKLRKELQEVSKGMSGLKVEFTAKSGEEGKLFGSITTLHIAQKLEEMGHAFNRKKIVLAEPIKSLGDHEIKLKLGAGVTVAVTVSVISEAPLEVEVPAESAESDEETVDGAESTDAPAPADAPEPSEEEMPTVVVNEADEAPETDSGDEPTPAE